MGRFPEEAFSDKVRASGGLLERHSQGALDSKPSLPGLFLLRKTRQVVERDRGEDGKLPSSFDYHARVANRQGRLIGLWYRLTGR